MGMEAERSLRVSVGWSTTDDECRGFPHCVPGRGEPAPLAPFRQRLSGPASATGYFTSNRIGADTAAFSGSATVMDPVQAPTMLNLMLAP